jgi:DNA polymerase III subunit beta
MLSTAVDKLNIAIHRTYTQFHSPYDYYYDFSTQQLKIIIMKRRFPMKLKFKKEDLTKGLQTVQKVAQNKSNNISYENGLLIKALKDVIEIQANDYDMGIKVIVPGIIEEPGEVFISNPFLIELTRRLPSDEIEMKKNDTDTKLTVIGGKSKFECLTMNPDDFNEVTLIDNGYSNFSTDSITLKNLIDNTSYACSTDDARPIFMGTLMEVNESTLTMVATDTHRLALKKVILEQAIEQPIKAIVPSRLLTEISRLMPTDMPQVVEITAIRNNIAFKFANVYIKTRLIEGEFPNYRRVIPSEFSCNMIVERSEFTGSVERASIIAKDSQYDVINFIFEDNQIKLTSQHPDYGTVEDYVTCNMEGEQLNISFNGKFILDILKHCKSDEIILKSKANSPMLVQEKGEDSYIYVVTPMRTR